MIPYLLHHSRIDKSVDQGYQFGEFMKQLIAKPIPVPL